MTHRGVQMRPTIRSNAVAVLLTVLIGSQGVGLQMSRAQTPTPITPSGLNTQVNLSALPPPGKVQYNIMGGTRPGGGANLFHSFGDFGVPTNNIANFLNGVSFDLAGNPLAPGLPTSNILGRVTGGNISNIFGTIQTTGFGNANLFLMNPAGFLFGPNATVNVGGMVTFTSADYLKLTDIVKFNASPDPAADVLLSASPVASFGFLGSNPGAITVQGSQFTVTNGTGISLVGGNIAIEAGTLDDGTVQSAHFTAPGGQINLASVASPGEIQMTNFLPDPGMTRGTINLSQGSTLDVSGDTAGIVRVRGGQFVIADATLSADTGNTNTKGAQTAIDINVTSDLTISDSRGTPAITARTTGTGDAGEVLISSANFDATTSVPAETFHTLIDTHSSGTGAAGSVTIATGNLTVAGPAGTFFFIDSGPQALGPGGNVTITAQGHVDLSGTTISTGAQFAEILGMEAGGPGGNLTLTADTMRASDAHFLTEALSSLAETERGGDVTMNVRDITMMPNTGVSAGGTFGGGAITINADRLFTDATTFSTFTFFGPGKGITFNGRILELTNGSSWSTSTFGDFNAGNITVNATDHVSLIGFTGTSALGEFNPSGFFTNSLGFFGTQGSAGNIFVTTPKLTMIEGRINTSTATSGRGGDVTVNAGLVEMSGEFPNPTSGDFFFNIGNIHPSGIFTETVGSEFCAGPCGNAGNITANIGSLVMGPGSQINSGTSNTGQGGNITIRATDQISVSGTLTDGSPVGVFSRTIGTTSDAGSGGNISLTAGQSVTLSNGASVSASSTGPGNAGNITIQGLASPAESVLIDGPGSGIFTDTQGTGAGGNIFVNANTVTLQNGGTLSATTSGTNNGGDIQVDATTINLLTFASINTLSFLSDGSAGNIALKATQQITAVDSFLNTDAVGGTGLGGDILLRAPTIGLDGGVLSAGTSGTGHAGNVLLEGQQISLGASPLVGAQGADLFAGTSGSGHGGTVTLRGLDGPTSHADNVTISGTSRIHTLTGSDGYAGDITINAARFTLTDHATLNADTFGSGGAGTITITATDYATVSGLSTTVSSSSDFGATGNAGQISVSAPTVMIENGGHISTKTTGEGTGGNINILAGQSVTLNNGSSISASSSGLGNAGNILINAGQNYTSTDSAVTTQAAQASGGNITVLATDTVQLTNSQLNASVQGSSTTVGGNITIDPQYVILQNSQILAQATQGQGGAISIAITNGGLYLPDATSTVSASSQFGVNGSVTIQSPNAPASGKIQPLGKSPLQATSLLNQRCAALAGGEFSSFTVAGRDSLPTEPGSWLASPLYAAGEGHGVRGKGLEALNANAGIGAQGDGLEGDAPILSLRQIAPAGFLTQTFAADWSAGCQS